jgi:hypothetical protein
MKVTKLQAQMLVLFLVSMFLTQNALLPVLKKAPNENDRYVILQCDVELLSDDQEKIGALRNELENALEFFYDWEYVNAVNSMISVYDQAKRQDYSWILFGIMHRCCCNWSGSFPKGLGSFFLYFLGLLFKIEFYVAAIFASISKDSLGLSYSPKTFSSTPTPSSRQISYLHSSTAFWTLLDFTHTHDYSLFLLLL